MSWLQGSTQLEVSAHSPRPAIHEQRRSAASSRYLLADRTSGIGAAETGESVARGRIRKRERWNSQRSFTPNELTLGALSTVVKQYNVGLNRSSIPEPCDARCNGHGASVTYPERILLLQLFFSSIPQ